MVEIAPSVLSADFARLGEEIEALQAAGCRIVHLDVMDGMFVPNITFGAPVIKALRPHSDMVFDVHLMIEQPSRYFDAFLKAGADVVTLHFEATDDAARDLAQLRKAGVRAGLSIKPGTPVEAVESLLPLCDLVLVMSVEPGFGGQSFQPQALQKLERLRSLRRQNGETYLLEVDGGVNADTLQDTVRAGADWLVMGSAFFKEKDYEQALKKFRELSMHA
ncbi:MAG: ribulose-phosphate 3-epimerase [Clostridia bacterium]|nr:ribulose-phosphate 3-epimerase [Clostridia bacterium]